MSCVLAVEDLFSVGQFGQHVITANEEPAGTEAFRFSTGRRQDHWSPSTFNADAWIKSVANRLRGADCIRLWDHNLLGKTVRLEVSNDDFTTKETIHDAALPTGPGAGDLDDALGVVTEDGMWLRRFPFRAAKYWRIYVPAMGASLKPSINGGVGMAYAFDRDLGELVDATEFRTTEERSEAGYVGQGVRDIARDGVVTIRCASLFEYEGLARYHAQQRFGSGAAGVLLFDTAQAERAIMARRPQGRLGFVQTRSYFYPTAELRYTEHEPRALEAS